MNGRALDRGIVISEIGDTHDDHNNNRPPLGSLRRVGADVWKAIRVMEPGCEVLPRQPGPLPFAVTVQLDSLLVGTRRRRRLTKICKAAAGAAVNVGVSVTVRIIERWRRD